MRIKNRVCIKECCFIIFIVVITSCKITSSSKNGKNKTRLHYSINLEDVIKHKHKVSISEMAEDIKYIPLETVSESLFGNIGKVIISDTNIYVGGSHGLLNFSFGGKFIRKIGRKGRGPGEYIAVSNFCINDKQNIIIVFEANTLKILWFNKKGIFLKSINKNLNGNHCVFINDNKIALYSSKILVQPDTVITNIIITDSNLDVIKTIPIITQHAGKWSIVSVPLYIYKDTLRYKDCFNDTLYRLNPDNLRPEKYAEIKLGSYQLSGKIKLPTQNISKLMEVTKSVENKLSVTNIYECEKYFIIKLLYGFGIYKNNPLFIIYNKDNYIAKALCSSGFINDLDGGLNFTPTSYVSINNQEYLIGWINAFELKAHVASAAFKTSTPKYPEKKKELEKLANRLKEDDNPVLMLVKLKDEDTY